MERGVEGPEDSPPGRLMCCRRYGDNTLTTSALTGFPFCYSSFSLRDIHCTLYRIRPLVPAVADRFAQQALEQYFRREFIEVGLEGVGSGTHAAAAGEGVVGARCAVGQIGPG